RTPHLGVRRVAGGLRVEYNVRYQAVGPLGREERAQLLLGAGLVVVNVAHGDKGRVPRPLVRVQVWRRLGEAPDPILLQHLLGLPHKRGVIRSYHAGSSSAASAPHARCAPHSNPRRRNWQPWYTQPGSRRIVDGADNNACSTYAVAVR